MKCRYAGNNFFFSGLLDSVSDKVFGEAWLLSDGAQSLKGNQIISEIEAQGGTNTTSGHVSDISFPKLARDALYIDKNANLESANFGNVTEQLTLYN